jgi:hypothetical protein
MAFTASSWGRGVLLTGLTPSASLSGFVALVSLANIPVEAIDAGSNSALNGGGDLRFSTDSAGSTQLPVDIVSFTTNASAGSRSCQVWIRFPTYAGGTRSVYMFYNKAGESQPSVGAAFGRNAVWVDFEYNFHFDGSNKLVDSTGTYSLTENGTINSVAGIIGDAADSGGNASNYYTVAGFNLALGSSARTYKQWFKSIPKRTGLLDSGLHSTGKRYTLYITLGRVPT